MHQDEVITRDRLTGDEYDRWRWVSPVLLYGWTAFVGWSRVHSNKHYISDVLVGDAAGYLMAELFLSCNKGPTRYDQVPSRVSLIHITNRF